MYIDTLVLLEMSSSIFEMTKQIRILDMVANLFKIYLEVCNGCFGSEHSEEFKNILDCFALDVCFSCGIGRENFISGNVNFGMIFQNIAKEAYQYANVPFKVRLTASSIAIEVRDTKQSYLVGTTENIIVPTEYWIEFDSN